VPQVVFPLLCVLDQLHSMDVVHRDIKPENVFITGEGEIALGDFGLAGHKLRDSMNERVRPCACGLTM
jgi:aurora kinase